MEKIDKLFLKSQNCRFHLQFLKLFFKTRNFYDFIKEICQFLLENLPVFTGKSANFSAETHFTVKIFSRKNCPLFLKNRRKSWQPFHEKIFKSQFNHIFKELRRQKLVKFGRASILSEVKMEKIDKLFLISELQISFWQVQIFVPYKATFTLAKISDFCGNWCALLRAHFFLALGFTSVFTHVVAILARKLTLKISTNYGI